MDQNVTPRSNRRKERMAQEDNIPDAQASLHVTVRHNREDSTDEFMDQEIQNGIDRDKKAKEDQARKERYQHDQKKTLMNMR